LTRAPPAILGTPSLHDALPIWHLEPGACLLYALARAVHHLPARGLALAQLGRNVGVVVVEDLAQQECGPLFGAQPLQHVQKGDRDRKSTRLNSSHVKNSYAVLC